jgi:hypothetical protein
MLKLTADSNDKECSPRILKACINELKESPFRDAIGMGRTSDGELSVMVNLDLNLPHKGHGKASSRWMSTPSCYVWPPLTLSSALRAPLKPSPSIYSAIFQDGYRIPFPLPYVSLTTVGTRDHVHRS